MSGKSIEQTRKEFEADFTKGYQGSGLQRYSNGRYRNNFVDGAFSGWQAAKEQYAPRECAWKYREDDVYITSCGVAHNFDIGDIETNGFKCCPHCGGDIATKEPQ